MAAPKRLGQYRLMERLGHGRTAEVYLARNGKQKVAIKLLHEYIADERDKQKFLEEARLVKKLNHPGIVKIISANFYRETRPYIAMTYAPGRTLRKKHRRGTLLPEDTIRSYTKQLAGALAYAHQQRIVHCDVKPENILVSEDDHLLLSDFGIAHIRETTLSQTTRDAFGTATYMAPEQFRGKYSPATDQYALATMVYEWFCGHPPFRGENHNRLMDQHMTMPIPSLREACEACTEKREISEEVEQVVLKALAKEPQARFPNIEEFAQTLEQALPTPEPVVANDGTPASDNAIATTENPCIIALKVLVSLFIPSTMFYTAFSITPVGNQQAAISLVLELICICGALIVFIAGLVWLLKRKKGALWSSLAGIVIGTTSFILHLTWFPSVFTPIRGGEVGVIVGIGLIALLIGLEELYPSPKLKEAW